MLQDVHASSRNVRYRIADVSSTKRFDNPTLMNLIIVKIIDMREGIGKHETEMKGGTLMVKFTDEEREAF